MGSGTLNPSLVMRIAVRMTGICPSGNSMSTAGPATWITFPNVIDNPLFLSRVFPALQKKS